MQNKGYETLTSHEGEQSEPKHPLVSANFFSVVAFWWMNDIFKIGSQRPLEQSDMFSLHGNDKTRDLTKLLQQQWNSEVTKCRTTGKQAKLWKSVLRTIPLKECCLLWCVSLYYSAGRIVQPLLLKILVDILMSPVEDRDMAYVVAALLPIFGLVAAFRHFLHYQFEMTGARIGSAVKGIVFQKVHLTYIIPYICC